MVPLDAAVGHVIYMFDGAGCGSFLLESYLDSLRICGGSKYHENIRVKFGETLYGSSNSTTARVTSSGMRGIFPPQQVFGSGRRPIGVAFPPEVTDVFFDTSAQVNQRLETVN